MLDHTKKELTLEEAKANFKATLMEFDPVRIIRRKPLGVVGAVVFAGLLTSFMGRKLSRALLQGPQLVSGIIKKLI